MRKWLGFTLIGLLALALVGGAVVLAQEPEPGQEVARRAALLGQKLGVTREQAEQIRSIVMGPNKELERLQKAVRVARLRLSLAIEEEAPDDQLAGLVRGYEAAAKPLRDYREGQLRKAFAVLTVRQQARIVLMDREDWWRLIILPPRPPGR